jgi:uncharacterized damage-inducible protein DinB
MHPRLTELRNYVDTQRSALLSAAAALPRERWTEHPGPDRWSVVELFEHLYKVEHSCARMIAKGVAEARAAGHPPETSTESVLGALDAFGLRDRTQKRQVPERVAPEGGWSPDESLEKLTASRAELHDAIRAGDGLALGSVHQTHARLGEIDLYKWILFVGEHEARHTQQAAEIVEQLGASAH